MDILLINPPTPLYMPNKEYMISTGLLAIASILLRDGYDVDLLDLNIARPWEQPEQWDIIIKRMVHERLTARKPQLVGIGCLFSGQFPSVLTIARTVKEQTAVPIMIGGMHPTIYPKEILENCPDIDYIAIGEGEEQALAIAAATAAGLPAPKTDDGIAYRLGGEIIIKPKTRFFTDLDQLPDPAYHLMDFADYAHDTTHWHNPKGHQFTQTVPIISSRSCPMRCNFCSMFLVMGPTLRRRSPVRVVDEIELLVNQYGQRHFSFMDDNINLHRDHILGICSEIRRRKLDIQFETPNGLFTGALDRKVMDAMYEAGWVRGAIAVESGSDFIRNRVMGKRLSREKILEVTTLAKRYKNLYFKAYFIIGMPEETSESLRETYNMIEEIDVDDPYVTNLIPFPGTKVFDQALRDGLLVEEIDLDNLWRMQGFHYHNNRKFYLKPYELTLEELAEWRWKFDLLLERHRKQKKLERLECRNAR